jgi:D-lactate dehydrogenase
MINKVAWYDAEDWEKEYLDNIDEEFEIKYIEEPLSSETVSEAEGCDAVSVFVSSEVDENIIEDLDVELIGCRSTGYDHVNIEAASKHDIKVCNVPEYGAVTVAEHTFGLMLALSRKIYSAVRKVQANREFDHSGLRGFDLEGKKIGVIGTGSIGKEFIKRAKAFNMEVIASDPYPDHDAAEELGFMYVSREHLIQESDIISLHCPLTDSTRHLLTEEEFNMMEGTVILNTARGELINTEDLIEALEKDNVKAAGLDVLEDECYISEDIEVEHLGEKCDLKTVLEDHILIDRDDVLVTPHNAFNSIEAKQRIVDTTLENIKDRKNFVNP